MTSPSEEPVDDQSIDRRRAVRRIATMVGLGAGAVALPAMTGTAEAKAGDTMRTGSENAAGDAQTALQSEGSAPSLRIENTRSKSGPAGNQVDLISPQLQLGGPVPSADRPQLPDVRNLPAGAIGAAGGALLVGAELGLGQAMPVQVHTSAISNMLVPIPPASATIFDSAALTPDQRAVFPSGSFDSSGRVAPGVRVPVSLRTLINSEKFTQPAAACCGFTVGAADYSGAVSVHASADLPGDVTVCSYTVLPKEASAHGQPIALAATSSATVPLDAADVLWVSVSTATHLRIQVAAVVLPDPSALVEPAQPSAALSPAARRTALQRQALREMIAGLPNGK